MSQPQQDLCFVCASEPYIVRMVGNRLFSFQLDLSREYVLCTMKVSLLSHSRISARWLAENRETTDVIGVAQFYLPITTEEWHMVWFVPWLYCPVFEDFAKGPTDALCGLIDCQEAFGLAPA
jgi:hypothetical protein